MKPGMTSAAIMAALQCARTEFASVAETIPSGFRKKAIMYFKFTGPKEASYGTSPSAIDTVLTLKL